MAHRTHAAKMRLRPPWESHVLHIVPVVRKIKRSHEVAVKPWIIVERLGRSLTHPLHFSYSLAYIHTAWLECCIIPALRIYMLTAVQTISVEDDIGTTNL